MPKDNGNAAIKPSLRQILSQPSATALETFDAWNAVSAGHQRSEINHTSSTGWRHVRSLKLSDQYGKGGGSKAGEWSWLDEKGREKLGRSNDGNRDIRTFMGGVRKRTAGVEEAEVMAKRAKQIQEEGEAVVGLEMSKGAVCFRDNDVMKNIEERIDDRGGAKEKPIFAGLTVYINGSTLPLISDHKLKNVLVDHGAKLSIGLARRSVTHVILGRPNSRDAKGSGGGLAAGKLQREISRIGGMGVKFVGVEWVLESIKAGCRLPEARFANVHLASSKQRSVLDLMK